MKSPLRWTLALALLLPLSACGGDMEETPEAEAPAVETAPADEAAPADAAAMEEGALLNPNEAPVEQLATVPHLDTTQVAALIEGRPWQDMLAIDAVLAESLDETQREEVYGRLWLPIDLNAASSEEIMLIPGVGERMTHEFEEYRPYDAIERFRREIGKYVDEAEVARLERYVEIRGG